MEVLTDTTWLATLTLLIARATGVFVLAPVFSHVAVPARVRAFLAVVIALAAVGRMEEPAPMPGGDAALLLALGCEVLVGLAIGYAARLIFVGVELGAWHISQQMGLALSEAYDPFAEPVGPVRRAYVLLAIVIFLATGGHRALISGMLETLQAVPLAGLAPGGAALETVVRLTAGSFLLALQVAGPILVALLLATVVQGLLQRSLPQANLLSTGLPVRALLGLTLLAAGIWTLQPVLSGAVGALEGQVDLIVRAWSGS